MNTKQEDCNDDEVDPEVETSNLPEHPTPGQILHIDTSDAVHLTGSLMNDFCCEIVQVCINFEFKSYPPPQHPPHHQKTVEPLRKVTHPLKFMEKLHIHPKKLGIHVNRLLVHQSDSWFSCKCRALNYSLLNQVTQDQANCCIYSILGQLQNCPKEYSPVYFRRWIAHHFCNNIQSLWVKINPFHLN